MTDWHRARPWVSWAALSGLLLTTGGARVSGQFAARTELVEVYASVTDNKGEVVKGLTADAFTVLDEGVAQRVSTFGAGDFPLTVGIVLDRSFSMEGERIDAARAAARRIIDQLASRDRLLVLAVGGKMEVIAGFDASRARARESVDVVRVWGTSPIGDTVLQALDAIGRERGRRALIVLSDGIERESTSDRQVVLDRVRESGVLIYPIAIAPTISPLLTQLSALSGGRVVQSRDRKSAERAASSIAEELRYQYLLGYAPPSGAAGWRRIEVRMARPELRVRARQGYMAGPARQSS